MTTTMLTATNDARTCRILLGCPQVASRMARFLCLLGWQVTTQTVDLATQHRSPEEVEAAQKLVAMYAAEMAA
jgi:hypothetical protein